MAILGSSITASAMGRITNQSGGLAVVDVDRIFQNSTPGRAGEAHLRQVQEVLQKGLDELQELYAGRENTPEAMAAIREGHAALERQFAAERLAVRQVLNTHLENAVRAWFEENAKKTGTRAVAPSNAFFAYSPDLDVTNDILREMNKERPVFPALPTVTVQQNQPQTAAEPAPPAATPARQGRGR
jgi:Skp family chaperone for outer membrane proteins